MQKKVAIIHFFPIELYPPVLNLINVLSLQKGFKTFVFTNSPNLSSRFLPPQEKTSIYRCFTFKNKRLKILNYIIFNLYVLLKLILYKPQSIIYIETHSFLPVYLYKLLRKKVNIYIHYHELTTNNEYKSGMRLVRFYHKLEQNIYPVAKWISQTNETRLNIFKSENNIVNNNCLNTLPNYPPTKWNENYSPKKKIELPVKLIYIGTFASFETLYIKEFIDWVILNSKTVTLDVYSFTVPDFVKEYVKNKGGNNINFKGSIYYYNFPEIIPNYDVGVILYKKGLLTVIHNLPNKLYEYLTFGLDVWFPEDILGSHEMVSENLYPKILKLNFQNLQQYSPELLIKRNDNAHIIKYNFTCEKALQKIINLL